MHVKFLEETEMESEGQLASNEGGEESDPDVEMSDVDLKESEKLLDTGTPPRARAGEDKHTRPITPPDAAPPAPLPPPPPPATSQSSLTPPQEPTIKKRLEMIKNLSRSKVFQQEIEPIDMEKLSNPQIPGAPTLKHAENDRILREQVPENIHTGNTFPNEYYNVRKLRAKKNVAAELLTVDGNRHTGTGNHGLVPGFEIRNDDRHLSVKNFHIPDHK
jgi:hypothetical protein